MAFLLAAGLLVVVVLALLAWPWLHRSRPIPQKDTHRQLTAELGDDVAAGLLPPEDLSAAAEDIEPTPMEHAAWQPLRSYRWSWLALVFVPLAAVILYWQVGDWRAAIQGDRAAVLHSADVMLAELKTHLKSHPNDENGWITLGRADSAMGDYATAATAYAQAVRIDHEQDPDLLAAWGEARVLADPGHLSDQERAIFAAVLKVDPDNVRGLWYGGLLALADGDRATAIVNWQRLLGQPIPAPMAAFIRSRLTQLGAAATAATPAVAASGPRLDVTVKLAPELASKTKPGETLFVFVRNPQGGAPFAVHRLTVTRFPVTVALSDNDAMLAGDDLSHADGPIEITARLSSTGEAMPQKGDLFGAQRITLASGDQKITITIDRIVGPGDTPAPAKTQTP
ncbi:MAG: c-type cytochrome biogenesis protein CcmI [Gammaproteobacteria bacterium]